MKYEEVRKRYPVFLYQDYKMEEDNENIYLKYFFEIEGLTKFEPTITILKKDFKVKELHSDVIQNAAFHIGIIEAISYFKATCSEKFYIKCGKLKDEQIQWLKKLIFLGEGEFRYKNQITASQDEFINMVTEGKQFQIQEVKYNLEDIIIPIGGGKDSNVTLELTKQLPYKRFGFRINLEEVSKKCAEIAGLKQDEIIEVKRKMDPNLLELNQKGFLNGHTPFSALVAFITYFVSLIFGKKYIVLSNEESANESNIKGEKINHQYSKTLEYENDFREYVTKFICPNGPEYFSFLRPISEIQIAKLFSELEQYHTIFKSCNVGSKSKPWKWCCDCPKCLFAYIILSPFLYREKLVKIFGEDLFQKESLLQTFLELCGYAENKPFECVGTYREIRYAISQTIKNQIGDLPFLLKYYKENFELMQEEILHTYYENNNLPKEFDEILKNKIFEE